MLQKRGIRIPKVFILKKFIHPRVLRSNEIRARAMGRASARKRRMSHITIVLEERGL